MPSPEPPRSSSELYQSTKQNISLHIQNVFEDSEVDSSATVQQHLTVQIEGGRGVRRALDHYNLDVTCGKQRMSETARRLTGEAALQRVRAVLVPRHRTRWPRGAGELPTSPRGTLDLPWPVRRNIDR